MIPNLELIARNSFLYHREIPIVLAFPWEENGKSDILGPVEVQKSLLKLSHEFEKRPLFLNPCSLDNLSIQKVYIMDLIILENSLNESRGFRDMRKYGWP